MARIKRGTTTKKKHKSILKQTRGFRHGRKNLVKVARQASMKAGQNAYIGRKNRKRLFKSLWIIRINAACRSLDTSYSRFKKNLKAAKINLNTKVLSELAVKEPEEFKKLVENVGKNKGEQKLSPEKGSVNQD